MHKALILEDVYLRIGEEQIFSEVNMEAARGEIIAVCGTSASHKAYFVNLLSRTYPLSHTLSGRLVVDGTETACLSEEEMRYMRMMNIAVLPKTAEIRALRMSVKKYITLPFREDVKKTVPEILTDARRIMQLLGISDTERILRKNMGALSRKELRAVLYATALSTDPAVAIFFADEPDILPEEADELYALLIKVCKIKNITLLLLTSDIKLARRYGEQVFISYEDRILPLEGPTHPHVQFLDAAAEGRALSLSSPYENVLLSAVALVPERNAQRLYFTLHAGEVLALPCRNGLSVFSGQKKPFRGSLAAAGKPIKKNKAYQKGIMPVYASMALPPGKMCADAVCAYSVRVSKRLAPDQIFTRVGLPADYGQKPLPQGDVFETLRLGLASAAMMEPKMILLSDIDLLHAAADRYEILSLLSSVCKYTRAGALVFSENADVIAAVGTSFAPNSAKSEETIIENEPLEV